MIQNNIHEENSILKTVLFGNAISKVLKTKIEESNGISFQVLKKNMIIEKMVPKYIQSKKHQLFKSFIDKISYKLLNKYKSSKRNEK